MYYVCSAQIWCSLCNGEITEAPFVSGQADTYSGEEHRAVCRRGTRGPGHSGRTAVSSPDRSTYWYRVHHETGRRHQTHTGYVQLHVIHGGLGLNPLGVGWTIFPCR